MFRLLICAIVSLMSGAVSAAPRSLDWDAVKSDFIELRPVELPKKQPFLQWLFMDREFLKYDAGLSSTENMPNDCKWRSFKKANLAVREEKIAYSYFEKCEQTIQNGPIATPQNLYLSLMISLPVEEHPYMRRVFLKLPNGFKLPGLLAMKDTTARRPLIVFRAGIFGNSLDVMGERFLLIQMFEQSGFNVLMLDSLVSPESIEVNERYTAGGLDEGLQNYQVGRQLLKKEEPISKLISDIHFAALSMGGHGMWLTMILNQLNPKVFSTALGICPLVEFEKTFSKHQRDSFKFWQMNAWAWLRISVFRERVEGMTMRRFLLDAFDHVEKNYKGPLTDDGTVKFPDELKTEDGRLTDYKKGNNLAPLIPKIKTPMTVFSSLHDEVVPYDENGGKLVEMMIAQKGEGALRMFPMRESTHCSFPGAYDWDEMSDLLVDQFGVGTRQSHPVFVAEPPSVKPIPTPKPKVVKGIPLPPPPPPPPPPPAPVLLAKPKDPADRPPTKSRKEVADTGFPVGAAIVKVEAPVGKDGLIVEVLSQSEKRRLEIPISRLDWAVDKTVRSRTESNALIRWARHNIQIESDPKRGSILTWMVTD